ncbi:SBBP repeat-containing protein [Candidatus Poriferisocius sp.]|uniref:SBBP repeat-containing protein n=1 Tax=Candidatus Poriferisocius sp. TaxID=3101276 RepID=UPI003B5C4232
MRTAAAATAVAAVALVGVACGGGSEAAPEPWVVQVGTEAADTTYGVAAVPEGGVVVAGITSGSLVGQNQGGRDVFLARYSPEGELAWSRQFGGPENDSPLGVSVAPDGSVYVGGFTEGDLAGPHQGSADVWLARFAADGQELWRAQLGGEQWDRGFDVAAFNGGAYITGYTAGVLDPGTDLGGFDGFAARYDADGTLEWVRQFGTDATDWGQGAAVAPDGGLYVTGYTEGALGGPGAGDKDVFVVRLTPDGDTAWATQIGTEALDWTQGVGAGPDGGVLVAGSTEGSLAAANAGGRDMVVISLDAGGTEQWRWQAGTPGEDTAFEVRRVGDRIAVTGSVGGALGAAAPSGGKDAVVVWLNRDGTTARIDQFGTEADDDATGLDAAWDSGDDEAVYWSGHTFGSLSGAGAGASDLVFGRRLFPGSG